MLVLGYTVLIIHHTLKIKNPNQANNYLFIFNLQLGQRDKKSHIGLFVGKKRVAYYLPTCKRIFQTPVKELFLPKTKKNALLPLIISSKKAKQFSNLSNLLYIFIYTTYKLKTRIIRCSCK